MSITIDPTADEFRRKGTAKRTITMADQVPSQDVSRYQAVDPVPFRPRVSMIARLHLWWERTSDERYFWHTLVVLTVVSIGAAFLIVTR